MGQQQGLERYAGHIQGVESVRRAIRAAARHGVSYLTLYAFSTENWNRPAEEVNALMELFCKCVVNETADLQAEGVRVLVIGDRQRLPQNVQEHLCRIEQQTASGERLTLLLALNYSSRSELTHAVRLIARKAAEGVLDPETITEQTVEQSLYTAGCPDPDLIIRTSGEQRAEQLPALAGRLCRILLHPGSVARLHRRGVRPGPRRVCRTGATLRRVKNK